MSKLKERVALVTGAGRGIGRAIAEAFGREGARVAVTARTTAELTDVVKVIESAGGQGLAISADLAKKDSVAGIIGTVADHWGPVAILVNNAGIGSSANPKPVVNFDDDFWELTLRLNLTAPYLLSKAVLPEMLARRWGRIINIASINSRVASLHASAYTASKHGLLGFTRALALEVAKDWITVNAICPGPVHTIMNDKRIEYDAKRRGVSFAEQEAGMTLIGAPLAVYLASDEARMVTGQGFNICGGNVMS